MREPATKLLRTTYEAYENAAAYPSEMPIL